MQEQHSEEWRPVPGYEGYYEVSNLGRVRSLDRYVNSISGRRLVRGRVLAQSQGGQYLCVSLSAKGRRRTAHVHRLVCRAFIGEPNQDEQVRHKDGDSLHNAANNLHWGTAMQNAQDRDRHGTTAKGERTRVAKLTEKDVLTIRQRNANGESVRALARAFSVSSGTIQFVVTGATWKHLPVLR